MSDTFQSDTIPDSPDIRPSSPPTPPTPPCPIFPDGSLPPGLDGFQVGPPPRAYAFDRTRLIAGHQVGAAELVDADHLPGEQFQPNSPAGSSFQLRQHDRRQAADAAHRDDVEPRLP